MYDVRFISALLLVIDAIYELNRIESNKITTLCRVESYFDYAERHDGLYGLVNLFDWEKILHYKCVDVINLRCIEHGLISIKKVIANYPNETKNFGEVENYISTKLMYYSDLMKKQKPSCVDRAIKETKESYERYKEEKAARHREHKAKMCAGCEIDEKNKKNKFPESKHFDNLLDEILFGYNNPGVMKMKNGDEYSFWQGSDYKWEIRDGLLFTTTTKFDKLSDLLGEFVKRCQKEHCN